MPQNIIDDPIFFEKVVVDEFSIDEAGNIYTKGDDPQSVDNYIVAMQKDRPHWMPLSQGGTGNDTIRGCAHVLFALFFIFPIVFP